VCNPTSCCDNSVSNRCLRCHIESAISDPSMRCHWQELSEIGPFGHHVRVGQENLNEAKSLGRDLSTFREAVEQKETARVVMCDWTPSSLPACVGAGVVLMLP
jgi:hypothetical protein